MRSTILALLLAIGASGVVAQEATPTPCSYGSCALRLERRFWSTVVVQGVSGEKVGSIGFLGNDLSKVFQRSDSALVYAAHYKHRTRRGTIFMITGTAALAASAFADYRGREDALLGLGAAAVVFTFVGTNDLRSGLNSLDRAVWWHNRDLADK